MAALVAIGVGACSGGAPETKTVGSAIPETIFVTSSAFDAGTRIPSPYTCEGRDVPPPLQWAQLPLESLETAVFLTDLDAPGFIHWGLFGIDPAEKTESDGALPPGAKQATNSFGTVGYRGPCPPVNKIHDYVFTVYALGVKLPSVAGAKAADVFAEVRKHAIAQGVYGGTFKR